MTGRLDRRSACPDTKGPTARAGCSLGRETRSVRQAACVRTAARAGTTRVAVWRGTSGSSVKAGSSSVSASPVSTGARVGKNSAPTRVNVPTVRCDIYVK